MAQGNLYSALAAGDFELSRKILQKIETVVKDIGRPIAIMHVCGTHAYTVAKNGIRDLLPKNLRVISGPGCPVCVCPASDIELALELGKRSDVIIATFGDMMRVPGVKHTLYEGKAKGMDVRVVYGPNDAVDLAKKYPEKEVIFFAIGFETTAPLIAYALASNPPSNFSIIGAHKLVPPAMEVLLTLPDIAIDGFLLPGHVCSIIGAKPFEPAAEKYHSPMVVGGFEVNDVLISLYYLLRQIKNGEAKVENSYTRIVRHEGNIAAQDFMAKVFESGDAMWRGIGVIPGAGYVLREEYQKYNAVKKFGVVIDAMPEMPSGCACDQVLIGKIPPQECPLFGKVCTPQHPIGPCMVSHEGSCKIAFTFKPIESD